MELTTVVVEAVATHGGMTEGYIKDAGFVADSRIANNILNEVNALLPKSKPAMAVIKASETVEEVIASIKKQTSKAILNRAVTVLKEKLEAKATNYGRVFGEFDNVYELGGTLNVDGDGSASAEYQTYGVALLKSIVKDSFAATEYEVLKDRKAVQNVIIEFLNVEAEAAWTMMDEFNENFSTALAFGEYRLGLGQRIFTIKKEDSEEHKQALLAAMAQHNLTDAFSVVINEVANKMVAEQQQKEATVVEEQVAATVEEQPVVEAAKEEMVTITVTEYNMLIASEAANEQSTELLKQLRETNATQGASLIKAAEQLDARDKQVADLLEQIKVKDAQVADLTLKLAQQPVVIATPDTNTNTEEETKMTNPTFKIEIKDLTVVEARPAKEGKVVSKKVIKDLEVGNVVKAQVVTVDALKSVNEKIRVNAPIVTVKVANATHTGIDKVAEVAHKTTNVIAKAANTTVLKSANAVDAVLDFVAPTEKRVDVAAIRRMTSTVQINDVVDIAGRLYTFKGNGHYEAL